MALPVVDIKAPGVKELIEGSVKEIANTIFASASVSITAAAKAVAPSIPQMVADITEDLRAGPVERFSKGLEKLDKLLQNFGGDLKDYSKELAKFVEQREKRIEKSETTIRELRESGVKAEIDDMGAISILSQEEISKREVQIENLNTKIKTDKENLEIQRKLLQEQGVTQGGEAMSKDFVEKQDNIIAAEQKREKLLVSLNKTEEDTSNDAQMSIRERASKFVDDYVPDQIRDIGGALVDGLMAPVNAVKDLGRFFGSLLKPLKFLLKPLKAMGKAFKGLGKLLFGFMKKAALMFKGFIVGMMGTIASMLPFIAIGLAIVIAIGLVIAGLVKLLQVIEENKEGLIAFKNRIMEIPGKIKDFFDEKFTAIGEAFNNFVENVKAIPGKISNFFKTVFAKIQNFFIDAINGIIGMYNKLPLKDIEMLENVPLPADNSAEIVPTDSSGGTVAAVQSGTGTATASVPPFLSTNNSQANSSNNAAVINNNAVNNNSVLASATSAKNNDAARQSLYSDASA